MERYIELLCRFQPEAVYNFLKINDNYRLEEALDVRLFRRHLPLLNFCNLCQFPTYCHSSKVCSKARLNDATSYLLERSGDAMGAFKLILEVSELTN